MIYPRVEKAEKVRTTSKIYLSIPHQGDMRPELAKRVIFWTSAQQRFYNVMLGLWPQLKPIDYARNVIIQDFLKSDCTHILMIDSDMIPPPNVLELVDYGKDIIGGLCPILWQGNLLFTVMYHVGEGHGYTCPAMMPTNSLLEVDATGTGCILIHRRVFEAMSAAGIPWFQYELEQNGCQIYSSEDYYFCREAKKLGFSTYVHTGYLIGHVKEVDLLVIQHNVRELMAQGEAQKAQYCKSSDFGAFFHFPTPLKQATPRPNSQPTPI